jgi:hypothetical protein
MHLYLQSREGMRGASEPIGLLLCCLPVTNSLFDDELFCLHGYQALEKPLLLLTTAMLALLVCILLSGPHQARYRGSARNKHRQ